MGSKGVLLKKIKTTAVDVAQVHESKFSLLLFGKWGPNLSLIFGHLPKISNNGLYQLFYRCRVYYSGTD